MTLNLFLLIWCSIGNQNASGYCYDSVFADIALNNGINQSGIAKYIDVFTWKGWATAFYFALIYYAARYLLINTYYAGLYGLIYLLLPTTEFCKPGELDLFGWDICEALDLVGK